MRSGIGFCIYETDSKPFESKSVSVPIFKSWAESSWSESLIRDFNKFSLALLLKISSKVIDIAFLIFLSIGSQIF